MKQHPVRQRKVIEPIMAERLKTYATAKDKCQIGDDSGCNIVTQVASINPWPKSWDTKQIIPPPPPLYSICSRLIIRWCFLFCWKSTTFSNMYYGSWEIRDPAKLSQLLLSGIGHGGHNLLLSFTIDIDTTSSQLNKKTSSHENDRCYLILDLKYAHS